MTITHNDTDFSATQPADVTLDDRSERERMTREWIGGVCAEAERTHIIASRVVIVALVLAMLATAAAVWGLA